LNNVLEYLNNLSKRRKRLSATINVDPFTNENESKGLPASLSIALGSSLKRRDGESDQSYRFRLETDLEETDRLHAVLEQMVNLHVEFLTTLSTTWDEQVGTFLIAPAVVEFTKSINRIYTTYGVLALSGVNKSHLTLATRGEVEYSEFVNSIVNKYVSLSLKDEQVDEPTEWDWSWYLKRPIHRLSSYPEFLGLIHGETKVPLKPKVDEDNRHLRISSIKLRCMADALSSYLHREQK
jgi:hypothetical protein